MNKLISEKSIKQSFRCENCGVNLDFAEAMESSFLCFSCSQPLEHTDNTELVEELNRKVHKLSEEIKELEIFLKEKEKGD